MSPLKTELMTQLVSDYLDGQTTLPSTFYQINHSFYVLRVGFLDKKPQNRFVFNIFTQEGTYSLKRLVTRGNIDLAFDLAILLYFKVAIPRNSSNPGYILGWYGNKLATTIHHKDVVKGRYEELLQTYPEINDFAIEND